MTVGACLALVCFAGVNVLSASSSSSSSPPPPSDPCDRENTNGCTTLFRFPFQKEFTPSCNRHDICYGCAVAYGLTRKNCDEALLRNVVPTCEPFSTPNSNNSKKSNWLYHFLTIIRKKYLVSVCKKVNKLLRLQNESEVVCDNNMQFLRCIESANKAYIKVFNLSTDRENIFQVLNQFSFIPTVVPYSPHSPDQTPPNYHLFVNP
ncbi:conopeptide [Elysia marginata]|uniref:Conopeptide n=1 Tax=Elysia marginata TaxID=1093978 RepID=A0AAV4HHZ0_9GAST|nr:conopeptide [Elysia marginata]